MTLPHSQATPTNWKMTLLSQPHPLGVSQLLPLNYSYDAFNAWLTVKLAEDVSNVVTV